MKLAPGCVSGPLTTSCLIRARLALVTCGMEKGEGKTGGKREEKRGREREGGREEGRGRGEQDKGDNEDEEKMKGLTLSG